MLLTLISEQKRRQLMLGFFAKMLGSKMKRASQPQRLRQCLRASIGLEELTPRVLPSASPFGLAGGHFAPEHGPAIFSGSSSGTGGDSSGGMCTGGGQSSGEGGFGEHHDRGATLFANLSDSSGATGTALFNANDGNLFVKVTGATASSTLPVVVDGTTVGSLTTNASGSGFLKLTGITAAAGNTITVGDLTGTLAQVKYTAALTGSTTSVSGSADFNALKSRLYVSITGAAADTTYNVTVDGTVVGKIATNASGAGKLYLKLANVTVTSETAISIADTQGDPAILQGNFS
jgi:hypothetical protein